MIFADFIVTPLDIKMFFWHLPGERDERSKMFEPFDSHCNFKVFVVPQDEQSLFDRLQPGAAKKGREGRRRGDQ
jgi:hypothetical protein